MNRMLVRLFGLLACWLGAASSLQADPVNYSFSGVFTDSTFYLNPTGSPLAQFVGQPFTGTLTYDTAKVASSNQGYFGNFLITGYQFAVPNSSNSLSLSVNGQVFSLAPSSSLGLVIGQGTSSAVEIDAGTATNLGQGPFVSNLNISLLFLDPNNSVVTSNSLPVSFNFPFAAASLTLNGDVALDSVQGFLDNGAIQGVPAPPSFALLGIGCVVLGWWRVAVVR